MKEKEFALELVDKYKKIHLVAGGIGINEKQAIECAIICVNELFKSNPLKHSIDFMRKVRTELNKLKS